MSFKEQATNQKVILAQYDVIAADGTHSGVQIDVADFGAVYFALEVLASDQTNASDVTLNILESDTDGMADATVVTAGLCYSTDADSTDALSEGDACPKQGCIASKRYLKSQVVISGFDGSSMTIAVVAIANPLIRPVAQG